MILSELPPPASLPFWVTSNAIPVLSFDKTILSVTLMFVLIVFTSPWTLSVPWTNKLEVVNDSSIDNLLKYTSWPTDKSLFIYTLEPTYMFENTESDFDKYALEPSDKLPSILPSLWPTISSSKSQSPPTIIPPTDKSLTTIQLCLINIFEAVTFSPIDKSLSIYTLDENIAWKKFLRSNFLEGLVFSAFYFLQENIIIINFIIYSILLWKQGRWK